MAALVSIVMCTRDREQFIARAVKSVQQQSFTEWELIIADDGSKDRTTEIVAELVSKDARIVHLRNATPQMTIAQASNWALRHARGAYVAILDDDDAWCDPDKLRDQVAFLNDNTDCVGCGGGIIFLDKPGNRQGDRLWPETDGEIRKNALFSSPMANSTTLFRRITAEKIGSYDESLPRFADWDFWLRMGLEGKLYNFKRHFAYYTKWPGNRSFGNHKENFRASFSIVRRYKGKYPNYYFAIGLAWLQLSRGCLPSSINFYISPAFSRIKKWVTGSG
jgi:glycosyltransferase involved in cell wall biosynthesis